MKITRKKLIAVLESVTPGLATREENVEQSSCFVFRRGKVYTYNEEIMCSAPLAVEFEGAVPALLLLNLLRKLDEDTIVLKVKGQSELRINGRNKSAGVRFEAEAKLPVDKVEIPKKWNSLPDGFTNAIDLVKNCASTNDLHFGLSCVHFAKNHVEAMDNAQACRAKLRAGFTKSCLVRRAAVIHLVSAGLTKMAETANWVHFRSPSLRVISCRRYLEKYEDLTEIFDGDGTPIKIPRSLADATSKAAVFTSQDATSVASKELVLVTLTKGKVEVKGEGTMGWYREKQKVKYSGPNMTFAITPQTLSKIAKEHTKARVSTGKLIIDGDTWRLVFCLYDEKELKAKQKTEDDSE
jgi:hypothetical protein